MPYWIAGALLAVVLLAVLIVWQACALSRCRFWCPSCGRLFRLPWTKLLFRRHVHEGLAAALPALRGKGLVRGAAGVQRRKVNGLSAEL